jgi:hypothetical protein
MPGVASLSLVPRTAIRRELVPQAIKIGAFASHRLTGQEGSSRPAPEPETRSIAI